MIFADTLFVIPARGGSKGIKGKNIKPLGNKPLLHYSIEYARNFASDDQICVSTDDPAIANCAAEVGYFTKFLRPSSLATDKASTYDVLIHAISQYDPSRTKYQKLILLQPTSPFREKRHLEEATELFRVNTDMVVSVVESDANPYFSLFEEDSSGFLKLSKGNGRFSCRQDAPKVFLLNGSIYIIKISSLFASRALTDFKNVVKYEMHKKYSIDIDTPFDWLLAELIQKNYL